MESTTRYGFLRSQGRRFTRRVSLLVLPLPAHEIEIATFVGLQNRLVEQMRVAAPGPIGRNGWCKRRVAFLQFGSIDQEIDAAVRDIEADHVAVPDQRQRT